MARFERLREHLPSLYRPDTTDTNSLLARFLQASAKSLDTIDREASEVMQSHWWAYADHPLYNPFFLRGFQLRQEPLPKPGDDVLAQFPYILDLARLAALLPLLPWQDPLAMRELVEAYRLRIRDFVQLYKDGLTTLTAIRRMVEVSLPRDLTAPTGQEERPFWIEEFAPIPAPGFLAPTRGQPAHVQGPLMRWKMTNESRSPSAPTLYIEAVNTAHRPLIELYQAESKHIRIGIGYSEDLTPGQTLRLRPTFSSWLQRETGLERSVESLSNPMAPGPWSEVTGTPTGEISAVYQARDFALWVANNSGGVGQLFRFDGTTWTLVLDGLGPIHCLSEETSDTVLIGTTGELLRMPLFPEGGFTATPVASLTGRTIFALLCASDNGLWVATDDGLMQLATDLSITTTSVTGVEVCALHEDESGTLYIGGAAGLLQRQADGAAGRFFQYLGGGAVEQEADWQALAAQPLSTTFFLPTVTAIHRGRDTSLWIGTEQGICRYRARSSGGLAFETVLEAFPDLGTMRVFAIREDEAGLVWFCTERGVFRFDGRDWWQLQAMAWVQLGRADTLYTSPPVSRGSWRFDRPSGQWQRLLAERREWQDFVGDVRSSDEETVLGVFWTDGVQGDLGQWQDDQFTTSEPVAATQLVVHFKPDEQRIVSGGIAAIPRLPVGASLWRYLSIEAEGGTLPEVRPFWTTEGRLLPPPANLAAPQEGRYSSNSFFSNFFLGRSDFDEVVFAYPPEARVRLQWSPRRLLSVKVNLQRRQPDEQLDPIITDRVWQGLQQVRAAGVRMVLALDDDIVKGI
jgi:hypothetical protein